MILIPLFIFLVTLYQYKKKGMFTALLYVIATKSIVDVFWYINYGPISVVSLHGIFILLMFIPILRYKKILSKKWNSTANYYLLALIISIILSIFRDPIFAIEVFIISITAYLGFFIIPILVNDRKKLKQLLIAIMISGIFPAIITIYQYTTGAIFGEAELRKTVGLLRSVGLYHDAFPTRFYGLITIFSILMFTNNFQFKNKLYSLLMFVLGFLAIFSVYLVFSKAGISILLAWTTIIIIYSQNKIKNTLLLLTMFIGLSYALSDLFIENIEQLFSKEIGYNNERAKDIRYSLAGRGFIWTDAWDQWLNRSFIFQIFGDGVSRGVHNEFLRIFLMNGVFGLLFLILFLFQIIIKIRKSNKNIKMFGLMIFSIYLIDSIGLTPGIYYYYNIFVWGMLGLIILNPNLFNKNGLNDKK